MTEHLAIDAGDTGPPMVDEFTFVAAITGEYVVEFWYAKTPGDPGALRTISPWEIDAEKDTVLGYDHSKDEIRKFSIYKASKLTPALDQQYVFPHSP